MISLRAVKHLLVASILGCTSLAGAAETDLTARVTAGAQVDSNPTRDTLPNPAPDIGITALGTVGVEHRANRLGVKARYDLGGQQFLFDRSVQTLVQSLEASVAFEIVPALSVTADGSAKDRRGADHPYSDLNGGVRLSLDLDPHGSVFVRAGAERFIFREDPPAGFQFSFATIDVSGGAQYRFDRHHLLRFQLGYEPRRYNSRAMSGPTTSVPNQGRRDSVLAAVAAYSYRGPFQLTLSYGYDGEDSNSFGESVYRHRVTLLLGVHLPWSVTLLGQANYQNASYPGDVYLSDQVSLLQDDETTNSVSAKVSRPLSRRLDLELRGAFYDAALPRNRLHYQRWVAGAGLTFRWP